MDVSWPVLPWKFVGVTGKDLARHEGSQNFTAIGHDRVERIPQVFPPPALSSPCGKVATRSAKFRLPPHLVLGSELDSLSGNLGVPAVPLLRTPLKRLEESRLVAAVREFGLGRNPS